MQFFFTCYLCITYIVTLTLSNIGILLLEMLVAKRPTDEIFKEGLSLSIFISAMDENEVLKVADRRLIDDYEYSTQSP